METAEYYRERLLEHYNHPRNTERLKNPDFSSEEFNHSCGDQIHVEGSIKNGVVDALAFTGSGCVVSQATASLLIEECIGKTMNDILALDRHFVESLVGIPLGPTRLRCAMLSLYALQHGLRGYQKEHEDGK